MHDKLICMQADDLAFRREVFWANREEALAARQAAAEAARVNARLLDFILTGQHSALQSN